MLTLSSNMFKSKIYNLENFLFSTNKDTIISIFLIFSFLQLNFLGKNMVSNFHRELNDVRNTSTSFILSGFLLLLRILY